MTDEEREDLNTFRHGLVKQARWWQWKAETLEKEKEQLKAENAALRERLEKAAGLPYSHLEMLKLLTCASICYAEIKNLIVARMGKSRDVADLFMECPTVQGTTLDLALYRLAESNLNCNKIKGFEEVINATGTFKDYLAKAEARLTELKGETK